MFRSSDSIWASGDLHSDGVRCAHPFVAYTFCAFEAFCNIKHCIEGSSLVEDGV